MQQRWAEFHPNRKSQVRAQKIGRPQKMKYHSRPEFSGRLRVGVSRSKKITMSTQKFIETAVILPRLRVQVYITHVR
jgi:hypothetical protein